MNPLVCKCANKNHDPRFIVITGGPGAGKTALLEMAKQTFCSHVAILPEAAGIIFSGGFGRKTTVAGITAAQRAIYYVQREQERMIDEEHTAAIALCDRGSLDGLAYWPNDSKTSLCEEVGTTQEEQLRRYHTVIHMRTPTATQGYNHKNPIRTELAHEAALIDERILEAWAGHPRRFIIESSNNFVDKAQKAIELIRSELPTCCFKPLLL